MGDDLAVRLLPVTALLAVLLAAGSALLLLTPVEYRVPAGTSVVDGRPVPARTLHCGRYMHDGRDYMEGNVCAHALDRRWYEAAALGILALVSIAIGGGVWLSRRRSASTTQTLSP